MILSFKKLNISWAPEPNVPHPTIFKTKNGIELMFYLNPFIYDDIANHDIGIIRFQNCLKYRLGPPNSEGFYRGKFRYDSKELDFYDFFKVINSDWKVNFPKDDTILNTDIENDTNLNHFIVFFKDETFECVAENYIFENIGNKLSFEEVLKRKSNTLELLYTEYYIN